MNGEKRNETINTSDEYGNVEHDMTTGHYTVSIQTGVSFGTKRQEAVEAITNIMALNPAMAQNLADLAIMNMDIPGAKEATARARAMVDPAVLAASQDGEKMAPEAVVTQLKQSVAQLTKENQAHIEMGTQLTQELKISKQELDLTKLSQDVDIKKAELDYKLKTRQMDINEAEIELQAHLNIRKMDLEEKQLELKGAEIAGNMASDMMDHSHKKAKHDADHAEVIKIDMPISDSEFKSETSPLGGKINPQ
jgi:hypothetical protein